MTTIVYGSTVEWSADSGTTYTSVPGVTALAVPSISPEYVDITSLDSAGGYREYAIGLRDAGEITLTCNYSPALYNTASGYDSAGTLIKFRTTLPLQTGQSTTGDIFVFDAYVVPALQQNAVGEAIQLDLNLRVTGQPTFTQGS